MVATKQITTADLLVAGKATFALEGKGRRWTYRVKKVDPTEEGRPPVFFVSLLTGSDNENDYSYMGMLLPDHGILRLTKASKFNDDTECVRGFRWMAGLIHNGRENEMAQHGFQIVWSNHCQRCGRLLTVPSSCSAQIGPECAKKM